MPRPTTKAQLLAESESERQALEALLQDLSEAQMTRRGVVGPWSIKDVLAHLAEWEQMVLGWLKTSQRGAIPDVPARSYKWSELPGLNEHIRAKHAAKSLRQVRAWSARSYRQVMTAIDAIPEKKLFTPGLYPWMNKNTLASYFTCCTSSHYRWARQQIRKGLKSKKS